MKLFKIPYKLVGGIMLIPVAISDIEGYVAFDTGAMQTAVNKIYFPKMQGEEINIAKFSEAVQENSAEEGILNNINLSGIELSDIPVLIMDFTYVENALKQVMPTLKFLGTIGIDIIKNYTILLDYASEEIILDPGYEFENQTTIPMKSDILPVIEVKILDHTYDFVLDTGANTCLLGESFKNELTISPTAEQSNIITIPSVMVGENEYKDVTAIISDISIIKKRLPVEGVIGYQILSPQRTILDFKNNLLIMKKN